MVLDSMPRNKWKEDLSIYLSGPGHDIHLVGAGNPLRGDDAAGLQVIDGLKRRYGRNIPRNVVIHAESIGIESVISRIDISVSKLVIFDAVDCGKPPGSIICTSLADSRYGFFATHNIPLRLIPSVAANPGAVRVLGIQPQIMDVHEGLSDTVSAAVEEVVQSTAALLGVA